ncbi:MAG: hypothetical protein AB7K24_34720 [Gemmataceae bacterium]
MNEPRKVETTGSDQLARHLVVEGLLALLLAVAQLVLLRGLDAGALVLFGLPPLLALAAVIHARGKMARILGALFLALITVGAILSRIPAALPNMGGVDRRLPAEVDRLLTWYACVYLIFLTMIVPACIFGGSLLQRRRGEVPQFSTFTCVLGLLMTGLFVLTLPGLIGALLGLWPWPN